MMTLETLNGIIARIFLIQTVIMMSYVSKLQQYQYWQMKNTIKKFINSRYKQK